MASDLKKHLPAALLIISIALVTYVMWPGSRPTYAISGGTGKAVDLKPLPKKTTILVCLDGFRWDYPKVHPGRNANLAALAARGAKAAALNPVFPTLTFPIHYTMLTGLHPENHGLLDNYMWDPERNADFAFKSQTAIRDPAWFAGAEPIWVTAARAGKQTMSVYFPTTHFDGPDGIRPIYRRDDPAYDYNGHLPFAARVDEVLAWLAKDEFTRPDLVLLYYSDPDHQGHLNGPESEQVARMMQVDDDGLGTLAAGIAALNLTDFVNTVVVSDHGMLTVTEDLLLDDYLPVKAVKGYQNPVTFNAPFQNTFMTGFTTAPRFRTDNVDALMAALSKIPASKGTFYRTADVPAKYHWSAGPGLADVDVVGILEPGVRLRTLYQSDARAVATHGWNPWDGRGTDLRGIFAAAGPDFRPGTVLDDAHTINLYELLAHLLGIDPLPNDGDIAAWAPILTRPPLP